MLQWSDDERYLASASFGGEYTIREVPSLAVVMFQAVISRIKQVYFQPESQLVFELDRKGNFEVKSRTSNKRIFTAKGSAWGDERLVEFAYHPNYDMLALAHRNGNIKLYRQFTLVDEIFAHQPLSNVVFNEAGTYLCCICRESELLVYQTDNGKRDYVYASAGLRQAQFISNGLLRGLCWDLGSTRLETFDLASCTRTDSTPIPIPRNIAVLSADLKYLLYS